MKIYLSVDLEGIAGITSWVETERDGNEEYTKATLQMTKEANAACIGALKAGAKEIVLKDAHSTGRNIDHRMLPKEVKLIRGWSGHPFCMVQELDSSFDALMFVGYHSKAHSNTNPLAHTMSCSKINYMKINGDTVSEFLLHSYIAAYLDVPVVFISGDKGLIEEVNSINKNITGVSVSEGIGDSSISIHPDYALELIEKGAENSLKKDLSLCKIDLPKKFKFEICYKDAQNAYKASFYPGMKLVSARNVALETEDYMEVLKAMLFLV